MTFAFYPASFQYMQVLRFAVEEINNSTILLPGVKLGYEIFDYCSDSQNFGAALDFLSANGSVPVTASPQTKVISVTGPFGSTQTITIAPLFMSDLIPMVTHGATSVQLSNKKRFPSFFRTVPSDNYQVKALVNLLQVFGWNWVAFIGGDNDYSRDAFQVFTEEIRLVNICLAYQETISKDSSKFEDMFSKMAQLNVSVVVLFANQEFAIPFIRKAIEKKLRKMWIASETWSLNQELIKEQGIETIGNVFGIAIQGDKKLRGFEEFVRRSMRRGDGGNASDAPGADTEETCNQACSACLTTDPQKILDEDPTYRFSIYSAVYAVAHALHQVLQCGREECNGSSAVYPYMVTKALKKVNFELYNQSVKFDENGDPTAHYDIAPEFRCSPECKDGYRRVQTGYHSCCFECVICIDGTYINYTDDPYSCKLCGEDEWSTNGSTSCTKRSLEYLHHTELLSIGILFSASFTLVSSVAITVLFALKYDTPVVKSAGGKMCFLMLGSLCLSSISVFFFFGRPGRADCILRNPAFSVFYTGCMSCLAVRSFQIVCIFKMATKLPRAYNFWAKHNGQWVVVAAVVGVQLLLCTLWIAVEAPEPVNRTVDRAIVLDCSLGNQYFFYTVLVFLGFLSVACFLFAYMGTDLPKNYNEGKCITFSLLIFYFSWTMYLTVQLTLRDKHRSSVNAISELCTLLGILLGYFFPKCYIIIFKPDHNTAAYFQTSIQSYTIHTSNM
ncbi:taste receptor type 1 member 1-like [Megalops cyprinoides]|uniref:taste receptor type 1 member 1-like n=1 Tax=Megalops cyprinoides TaxID=118141 RepID=UPI001864C096|nr:taste receptor type 1 member 1-like [Megalops cyprinoides]